MFLPLNQSLKEQIKHLDSIDHELGTSWQVVLVDFILILVLLGNS